MKGELPIGTIRQIIWGDQEVLDEVDLDAQPNLMDDFILRNQVQAAVKSANGATTVFDLALPPESDVDDDDNSPFYKSPVVLQDDGRRTLKKRLGITRSEEVKAADGSVWLHGFDASNQLVDARLIESAE
jgi:hypothetical protein